jgi:hypothetical protein
MGKNYVRVYEELVEEAVSSQGQAVLPSLEIPITFPELGAAEERQLAAFARANSGPRPFVGDSRSGRERLALADLSCTVAIRHCGSLGNRPPSAFASVKSRPSYV